MKTIEKFRNEINRYLNKNLPETGILSRSIRYSTLNGGKRIRPISCMAGFSAVGGTGNKVIPIACAVELVHTFSLIHDDLPCMDNDDFRRGKPANHKVFGEDIAVLSGDALLSLAFEWIVKHPGLSNEKKILVLKELTHHTGPEGLIGGQVLDIKTPKEKLSKKTIESIYMKKTSGLITTALRIGAIVGGAAGKKLTALTRYGETLGLAFQITDDLLDIDKDKDISYARLFGKENASKYANQLINKSITSLKGFGKKADLLKEIAVQVRDRV